MGISTYILVSNTPVQVGGLSNVIGVAARDSHSLALGSDGTVWAWGLNNWGQLGIEAGGFTSTPTQVAALVGLDVVAISAGGDFSLALIGLAGAGQ